MIQVLEPLSGGGMFGVSSVIGVIGDWGGGRRGVRVPTGLLKTFNLINENRKKSEILVPEIWRENN
jgi:hypothetical protein